MTVLHYVQRWLPLSEHYVHALVTGSRRPALVVSAERPEHADAFPGVRVVSFAAVDRLPTASRRPARTLALAALARRHRVAVVHAHFAYRALDVIGVCRRLDLPLVVSLHGHDATAFPRVAPGTVETVLGAASAVIVPSRFLADRVVALGAVPDRVEVIPAGVDTAWFTPTPVPAGPVVGFIGRLVEKKGLDVLMDAWPSVVDRVPGARLVVLGAGPLESRLRGVAGVECVRPDPVDRAVQARDVLRRARVIVTPSRTAVDGDAESLLLVNLEAQASGRPLVSTRHGGIAEFVDDGESALLVPEADARALADALAALLSDDALASRLAAAGPGVAARFDVRDCTALVDDVYDRLLAR